MYTYMYMHACMHAYIHTCMHAWMHKGASTLWRLITCFQKACVHLLTVIHSLTEVCTLRQRTPSCANADTTGTPWNSLPSHVQRTVIARPMQQPERRLIRCNGHTPLTTTSTNAGWTIVLQHYDHNRKHKRATQNDSWSSRNTHTERKSLVLTL